MLRKSLSSVELRNCAFSLYLKFPAGGGGGKGGARRKKLFCSTTKGFRIPGKNCVKEAFDTYNLRKYSALKQNTIGSNKLPVLQSGSCDVNRSNHSNPSIWNTETTEPTSHNKAKPSSPSHKKINFKVFKLVYDSHSRSRFQYCQ
jgi:hypothetical protein